MLLQRQLKSVSEQLPRSPFLTHSLMQAGSQKNTLSVVLLSMRRQLVSSEEQHTGDVLTRKEGGGQGQASEEHNRGKREVHYTLRVHS